jgi:hypothetical protein
MRKQFDFAFRINHSRDNGSRDLEIKLNVLQIW